MALTPITGTNWQTAVEGQARLSLVENAVFFSVIPSEPAGILGPNAKGTTLTINRPTLPTVTDVVEGTVGNSQDPGEDTGTITINHYRRAQISIGLGQAAQSNYDLQTIWGETLALAWLNDFEETAAALYAALTAGTFNATGTSQAVAFPADTATAKRNLITAKMPVGEMRRTHVVLSAGGEEDLNASSVIRYDSLGTPGSVEAGEQKRMGGFSTWISQNIVSAGSPAEDQIMYFHDRAMAKMLSIDPHFVAVVSGGAGNSGTYADLVQADILQYVGLYGVDVVEPTLGGVIQRLTAT